MKQRIRKRRTRNKLKRQQPVPLAVGARRFVPLAVGAQMLGRQVSTVRKWLRAGRLAYHRIGWTIWLDEDDIARFVDSGRVAARPEVSAR